MQDSEHTRRNVTVLLGGALATGLAGCTGGIVSGQDATTTTTTETNGTTTTEEPIGSGPETTENPCEAVAAGKAAARVAHLSPDAPNVDVVVDGTTVLSDVPFGTISPYLVLPPGVYNVVVKPTGGDAAVFDEQVEFGANAYTIAALGEIEGQNQSFVIQPFVDDVFAPAAGTTRIRLVHAAPDAPPVDVTVEGTDVTLFDDVAFGEASQYATPEAGDYTIEVRGATDTDDGDVVTTFDVSLPAGAVVSVFAVGYLSPNTAPANEPFDLNIVVDDAGSV